MQNQTRRKREERPAGTDCQRRLLFEQLRVRSRPLQGKDENLFDLEIDKQPVRSDVTLAEAGELPLEFVVAELRFKLFAGREGQDHGVELFLGQSPSDAVPAIFSELPGLLDLVSHEWSIWRISSRVLAPGTESS